MRYRSGRRGRSPAAHSLFLIATPSYLQAGAPSEVAIPAGSAPSLTKIEHVTFEPPTRLLFVIVASHPPPGRSEERRVGERVELSVVVASSKKQVKRI